MNDFCSYQEYVSKLTIIHCPDISENLEILFSDELFEKYINQVTLSPHAEIRRVKRYGVLVDIPKIEIDQVVYSAEKYLMDWVYKYKNFIIFDKRTTLNVVGTLHKNSNGFDFYVATVMYKKDYEIKNPSTDRKIFTTTSIKENNNFELFGITLLNE